MLDGQDAPSERAGEWARVGLITALWSTFGLLLLGLAIELNAPYGLGLLWTRWYVVALFIFGMYASSGLFARFFLWRGVRHHLILSIAMALVILELVAGASLLAGASVWVTAGRLDGSMIGNEVFITLLVAPFIMMGFALMGTLPLSIGLGIHIRVWSHLRERARGDASRQRMYEEVFE